MIDADTWVVGSDRVRLHAIDAFEAGQTCQDSDAVIWRCGDWASAQARAVFDGRVADCRAMDRDRYGRIVARCYVDGADVAQQIVGEGWAIAYRRYGLDYVDAEAAAVRLALGVHRSRPQSPSVFRKASRAKQSPPKPGCDIKGNISNDGARIYHLPHQAFYAATRINPAAGERWFCSSDAAHAAGWRRSKR